MPTHHDELLLALWRAGDAVRSRLGDVAGEFGVTFQQYMVLRILVEGNGTGVPTLEIASRMVERAPGITGLIDRLERRGLVLRQRSSADRRQIRCLLTGEGRDLLGRMEQRAGQTKSDALSMLTGHEVGVLRHLLARMGKGIDD